LSGRSPQRRRPARQAALNLTASTRPAPRWQLVCTTVRTRRPAA